MTIAMKPLAELLNESPAPTIDEAPAPVPQPTKKRSLFEVAAEFQAAVSAIEDGYDDGEIPESVESQLDAITGEADDKLEGCFKVLRHFETQLSVANEELDRVKRLHQARENRVKFFKNYILQSMLAMGMKKFEGKTCTMRVQKNSRPSIFLADGAEIPAEFRREKVVVDFNGQAAYEAWKSGGELPPEIRVVEGMHLRTA